MSHQGVHSMSKSMKHRHTGTGGQHIRETGKQLIEIKDQRIYLYSNWHKYLKAVLPCVFFHHSKVILG